MTDTQACPDFEIGIIGAGPGYEVFSGPETYRPGTILGRDNFDLAKRSRALRYYFNDLNGHVPTYYRNSQGDSTYARPTGFFAASRANRQFSFHDYHYEQRWAR